MSNTNNIRAALQSTNLIIAVGSVDGILTAAAFLRLIGNDEAEVCFTQAFTVDKIEMSDWGPARKVALVDLAVNNRDPAMTVGFVNRLREAGHTLVAVIDEHSREDWLVCLGNFEGLVIEPQSQNAGDDAPKSAGEVLKRALAESGTEVDDHLLGLMADADAADRMNFNGSFASLVNQAVKSRIQDDSRRVYLARHFAQNRNADETISGWISEYEAILANHDNIVENRKDLGEGIHRVSAVGITVDMTSLMGRLYGECARVVVLEGEVFVPAKKCKEVLVAFGTADKNLDLMATVRAAGVNPLGGFAQKVNVALEDEEAATAAIRAALQG